MSNVDFFNYEGQKAAAKESYDASTAKNAYARFLAQQRGARRKFDLHSKGHRFDSCILHQNKTI